jgi:hypothetical protein
MIQTIASPSKLIAPSKQPITPKWLQPDHIHVNVSMSERHHHTNIDYVHLNNRTIVEANNSGQWWSLNLPYGMKQIKEISDRAKKGLHSLIISQSSTDQTSPSTNTLLAYDEKKEGEILKTYRELKQSLLRRQQNIEELYINIRVICQQVDPSSRDKMIAMIHLPSNGEKDGSEWDIYNQPNSTNEFNLLNEPDDMLIRILKSIQFKHTSLLSSSSMKTSMLRTFSSNGRLSCGNGRTTYIKNCQKHSNWIIQLMLPCEEEPIEIQQRKYESEIQRKFLTQLRKKEAKLHEIVKVKLPLKIEKLNKKLIILEETRLSAIKRRQMKIAFSCVDKRKKIEEKINKQNIKLIEQQKILFGNTYNSNNNTKNKNDDGGGDVTCEVGDYGHCMDHVGTTLTC